MKNAKFARKLIWSKCQKGDVEIPMNPMITKDDRVEVVPKNEEANRGEYERRDGQEYPQAEYPLGNDPARARYIKATTPIAMRS